VATRVGMSHTSVNKIYRRFCDLGTTERAPGSGRPRLTTPKQDKEIVHTTLMLAKRRREPTAHDIREEVGLQRLSIRTIQRRIIESRDVVALFKKKKPFLTTRQIKRRLQWCKDH